MDKLAYRLVYHCRGALDFDPQGMFDDIKLWLTADGIKKQVLVRACISIVCSKLLVVECGVEPHIVDRTIAAVNRECVTYMYMYIRSTSFRPHDP